MPLISLPPSVVGLTGGYSDRFDIGTGEGRPGGVETVLEYNGAILNNRKWQDAILVNQIEGLADPDVRDSREVNPGRHGETYYNAFYGGRTLVLTGKIRAHTLDKLHDMQMGLKEVFGDLSVERPLYFRTGDVDKDVFIFCKKSQPIVMTEVQQNLNFERDFQITLRASNPMFLSYIEQMLYVPFGYVDPFATNAVVDYKSWVKNPNAAINTTGYTGSATTGTPTLGRVVDGTALSGTAYEISDTTTGAGSVSVVSSENDSTVNGMVAPSQPVLFRARVKVVSATGAITSLGVNRRVFNNVSGQIDTNNVATQNSPVVGTWYDIAGITTMPAAAAYANIDARLNVNAAGTYVVRVEHFQIVPLAVSDPDPGYFDGTMAYNRWTGTPHASYSERMTTTGLESTFTATPAGQAWVQASKLRAQAGKTEVLAQISPILLANQRLSLDYTPDATLTAASHETSLSCKYIDANNYVYGVARHTTNGPTLQIFKVDSGAAPVQLAASASTTALVAGTSYTLRCAINGNLITVDHFRTSDGAQILTQTYTLAGADATKFGAGVKGGNAIRLMSPSQGWTYDNLGIESIALTNTTAFTAINQGNAPSLPKLKVYGPLSAATTGGPAISLLNDADASALILLNAKSNSTLAIADGNYIEIDCDKRTVKEYDSLGNFIANRFDQIDVTSNWMTLTPGENPIEIITYAPSQPKLELRHRHTYL
jgi:hypothetical protein